MKVFSEVIKVQNKEFQNLAYHQARVDYTTSHHQLPPFNLTDLYTQLPNDLDDDVYKCRITYSDKIESFAITPYKKASIGTLEFIQCDVISYPFKFEDRTLINSLKESSAADEVIIVKNNKITDASIYNLVFEVGKLRMTPKDCLLKGTKRQELLDKKLITEESLTLQDIQLFAKIYFINAMVGLEDNLSIYNPLYIGLYR